MRVLVFRNRQKTRAIDLKLLRTITRSLLEESLAQEGFELGIHLVSAAEMAEVNQTFLQHEGSTDVITFDYSSEPVASGPGKADDLRGEIFICVDDAVAQARQFQTTWQAELVRYIVHATLHLRGYDDLKPLLRRKMKREENRLLKELSKRWGLSRLASLSKTPL